ncbi:CGNR zinc finger domain-containing protein [Plantactinospora sp. S1510]|uniref:CGNR zinc finger domain-containing protein n=1 Tax=Plantactinospora alkalitolerans TaxID=2789879 RepID=A0ABS0H4A4_9ACTN|nr:ABATE domain-containing protein [Plantactinospora alkalitolerans]MBF9132969.1 CGNR zinc finger domain-containing protein [Plantactinospora alkalitolerans]
MEPSVSDRWALADPRLAIDLLSTLRHEHDAVVDDLADAHETTAWLRDRHPDTDDGAQTRALLVRLRDLVRQLLTTAVDGTPAPPDVVAQISLLAAGAPVTLAARTHPDGTVTVERASHGDPDVTLAADLARSALILLAEPARDRLRLCRAPGCILFFLQQDPRQQWCSPTCGNRARVARHYARRNTRPDAGTGRS